MTTATPSATVYYVPSSQKRQQAGAPHYYAVIEQPGSRQPFRCECTAAKYGRRCWHTEAVVAGMVKPARPKVSGCALCGRTDTRLINSAGYLGTATDARICRNWQECSGQ